MVDIVSVAEYTTPLSSWLLGLSTWPLLFGLGRDRRMSLYVAPETLFVQCLAAIVRFPLVLLASPSVLQLGLIVGPEVFGWVVIFCQFNVLKKQPREAGEVMETMNESKQGSRDNASIDRVREGVLPSTGHPASQADHSIRELEGKVLSMRDMTLTYIACATALSPFLPTTLPHYFLLRTLTSSNPWPNTYTAALRWTMLTFATLLDCITPLPQYTLLFGLYSGDTSPNSNMGRVVRDKGLKMGQGQAPWAVWAWFVITQVGAGLRVIQMMGEFVGAKREEAGARVMLMCFQAMVGVMLVGFLMTVGVARRSGVRRVV